MRVKVNQIGVPLRIQESRGPLTLAVARRKIGTFGMFWMGLAVIAPRFVAPLVLALPVILVLFSVTMGGFGVAVLVADSASTQVFGVLGAILGVALLSDVLLIVGVLGWDYVNRHSGSPETEESESTVV